MEDLIAVIAGRPAIVDEIRSAPKDVVDYVSSQCSALLNHEDLEEILGGALSSSAQVDDAVVLVREKLEALAVANQSRVAS